MTVRLHSEKELDDLALLSMSHVRSTFYDDLADLLHGLVDDEKIQADYSPEGPSRS